MRISQGEESVLTAPISRREAIRTTALATLLGCATNRSASTSSRPDKSCILIWLRGGLSPLDSFHLNLKATSESRSPFRPIATNIPGILLCEHLPGLAVRQDRFAIVRNLKPGNGDHGVAQAETLSGIRFAPNRPFTTYADRFVEAHNTSNSANFHCQLGASLDPAYTGSDRGRLPLTDLSIAAPDRLVERSGLSSQMRYGETTLGRSCRQALASLLSGSRFITVVNEGWDHHEKIFEKLSHDALPTLDAALSSLIDDLTGLGRFESTFVAVLTDFGRSSTINRFAGRDHCSNSSLALFAGGGVQGGRVVGDVSLDDSVRSGRPIALEAIAATLCSVLGIAPDLDLGAFQTSDFPPNPGRQRIEALF